MSAKTEKSPSILGVYFYAVLIVLFGALLGFAYMMTFPPQAFSSQAEYQASLADSEEPISAPKPGDAYYIEGPMLRTRSWEAKRELLKAPGGQTVRLSAGEINAWMKAKFRPGLPPTNGEEPSVLIVPGVPNVAITDAGFIYLNLPTTITAYGSTNDFTVSARGVFNAKDLHFEMILVSSAKLPLPDLLGTRLFETLSQSYQSTEEYAIFSEAFARAESVEIADGELVLAFP
jgi:hypothetical protein